MTAHRLDPTVHHEQSSVDDPPRAPVRGWVARRLFRSAVAPLPVRVVLPGGERFGAGGPDAPEMRIIRPRAFFQRLGTNSTIGFGESYMAGDWTSPDLAALLTPFAANLATLIPPPLQLLRRWVDDRRPASQRNTRDGAATNIHRHYDLSNDLFATFLDESMTYSSAWFHPGDTLHTAQQRKIDGILDYANVGAGSRVLEIGTGWGALAIRAATRGARVTTLTLSAEQRRLAQATIADAGLTDRVRVLLRDYRDATGRYDAIVSVEMIEAVGHEYWPTYFTTLDRLLVPGGRIGLQTITMPHDRMLATRNTHTWIDKYIFPGGQIPSITAIEHHLRQHTTLTIHQRRSLRPHYARTLHEWRNNFHTNLDHVTQLGFDHTFHRMWDFYLAYAEAGFRSHYLDVWQLQITKHGA